MIYLVICVAAGLASGLTLFSGFGLGTLLVPVFAIFFPIEVAIALTAVVHFLTNLFKLALLGRRADYGVVVRFGLPALGASVLGAVLLGYLATLTPLLTYTLAGHAYAITPVKTVVAALLIGFAGYDLWPGSDRLSFGRSYLPLGGLLSGFFGGLSGNQGALRSAFLIRAGLSKEAYIATGVVIACLIDVSRLVVYAGTLAQVSTQLDYGLLVAATLSAFGGAYAGSRFVQKITIQSLQRLVAGLLLLVAIGLGAGLL